MSSTQRLAEGEGFEPKSIDMNPRLTQPTSIEHESLEHNNIERERICSIAEYVQHAEIGGGGGIRTLGTPKGPTVFETVTFVRSVTPPDSRECTENALTPVIGRLLTVDR